MKRTYLLHDVFRSLDYLSKPLAVRGLHGAAQTYCAERESSGVIRGAASFTPQMWYAVGGRGTNRRAIDVMVDAGLARWRGGDLEILGYDLDSESLYVSKRETGRSGGVASGESRRPKPKELRLTEPSTASTTPSSTQGEQRQGGVGEGSDGSISMTDPGAPRSETETPHRSGKPPPLAHGNGAAEESPLRGPMDLIRLFEMVFHVQFDEQYPTTPIEQHKAQRLWDDLDSRDRAALPAAARAYVRDNFDATLGGFVDAYPDYQQASRGAA